MTTFAEYIAEESTGSFRRGDRVKVKDSGQIGKIIKLGGAASPWSGMEALVKFDDGKSVSLSTKELIKVK